MYQLFALHALHQSLKKMDGVTLAEVEGFLDGGDDVGLDPIRETSVGETGSVKCTCCEHTCYHQIDLLSL